MLPHGQFRFDKISGSKTESFMSENKVSNSGWAEHSLLIVRCVAAASLSGTRADWSHAWDEFLRDWSWLSSFLLLQRNYSSISLSLSAFEVQMHTNPRTRVGVGWQCPCVHHAIRRSESPKKSDAQKLIDFVLCAKIIFDRLQLVNFLGFSHWYLRRTINFSNFCQNCQPSNCRLPPLVRGALSFWNQCRMMIGATQAVAKRSIYESEPVRKTTCLQPDG